MAARCVKKVILFTQNYVNVLKSIISFRIISLEFVVCTYVIDKAKYCEKKKNKKGTASLLKLFKAILLLSTFGIDEYNNICIDNLMGDVINATNCYSLYSRQLLITTIPRIKSIEYF